jgi:hypothetical protein
MSLVALGIAYVVILLAGLVLLVELQTGFGQRRWFSPRDASLSSCGVPASPVPPLSAVL